MARSDEFFTPGSIDEQIERYTHTSGGDYAKYNAVLNAHLMHQLHQHYQQDAIENKHHLEDAWHQLTERRKQSGGYGYNGRAGPAEREIRDDWQNQQNQQLYATLPQSQAQQEKSGKSFGRFALLTTFVLLCLLIAGVVVVFSILHP